LHKQRNGSGTAGVCFRGGETTGSIRHGVQIAVSPSRLELIVLSWLNKETKTTTPTSTTTTSMMMKLRVMLIMRRQRQVTGMNDKEPNWNIKIHIFLHFTLVKE
jgi:hypothetical protein